MKRLTAADLKRRDAIVVSIRTAEENLNTAVSTYNDAVAAAWADLAPVIDTYNEAVNDGGGFAQDMEASITEYIDERSDKWRESDAAESYETWRAAWELQPDEIGTEEPTPLSIEIESVADALENASVSVDDV
jgi:hypothetical protein